MGDAHPGLRRDDSAEVVLTTSRLHGAAGVGGCPYGLPMDLFESARVRVERARLHAGEMIATWNEYLEPHPFDFELVHQSDTVLLLRCVQHEPMPLVLPALFGEWLFNLRSALDHVIWAAAAHASGSVPPPNENGLQYPIYDDRATWTRNRWRIKELASHQIDMLETMQPFRSDTDANYLCWINRLARIDRHRRFTSWTVRIAEAKPVLAIPSTTEPILEFGPRIFVDGKCDFARVTFPSRESAEGVTYNPRVGIDPEIGEWGDSPFWSRVRFSERITMMMVFVQAEIDTYDFDCTGSSIARRTLTEAFAQESDLRRAGGVFPRVQFEPPEAPTWVRAAGRRSTAEKYHGIDFPSDGPHLVEPT